MYRDQLFPKARIWIQRDEVEHHVDSTGKRLGTIDQLDAPMLHEIRKAPEPVNRQLRGEMRRDEALDGHPAAQVEVQVGQTLAQLTEARLDRVRIVAPHSAARKSMSGSQKRAR